MPVVFRFDSLDPRSRAVLVLPTVEAAINHVRETFNLADHTLDEDGEQPVDIEELSNELLRAGTVRLYDQAAWHSDDTVEICCASW
jgi:hypothetical protein